MLVRQIIMAADLSAQMVNTYSWAELAVDGNTDGKGITCAYVPRSKGTLINLAAEAMLLGGKTLSKCYKTMLTDTPTDEGETITAEAITNNLSPMIAENQPAGYGRFTKIEFPRINPISKGLDITFAIDVEDPHIVSPSWSSLDEVSGSRIHGIPSGLGRSINFRIVDETSVTGESVFDGFDLHFLPLTTRPGDTE